jgi:uncharacterized damage-inducible protein DinB
MGFPWLFDYLYWLRDRILQAAEGLDAVAFRATPVLNTRNLRETLVHELDVEIGWLARLRGEPAAAWGPESTLDASAFPTPSSLAERWLAEEAEMRHWIGSLDEAKLAGAVTVSGLDGYPLWVYLMHLVEHGVMELTSAAAILTEIGRSPGDLGFLDALDDLTRPGPGAREDGP